MIEPPPTKTALQETTIEFNYLMRMNMSAVTWADKIKQQQQQQQKPAGTAPPRPLFHQDRPLAAASKPPHPRAVPIATPTPKASGPSLGTWGLLPEEEDPQPSKIHRQFIAACMLVCLLSALC
jgi:hypothetical protein